MMTPKELSSLIDLHAGALMLFARQWCAHPEDVVQESFLKLFQQRVIPNDPLAWLYRVVRNRSIDVGKTSRKRSERESRVARPDKWFVESEVDGLDVELAIENLKELPMDQREVIIAHLWGGLSFEQIADSMDCSASTAFRKYSAGIERLREKLGVSCPNQTS
jgi:RNA polymerase sigma factor (sigma-70 family)